VSAEPPFKPYLDGWTAPWYYATPGDTQASLEAAGFTDIRCWLETKTVTPPEPKQFLTTVVLGPHVDRLPEELREQYVDSVLDRSPDPLVTLEYIRLNIDARRPA
jgi:trans-aconitate 2-methyltransferase